MKSYIFLCCYFLWGGYRPSVSDVFFEIFALKRNIMVFCWYVPFYCISIFIIWAMYRLYDRSLFIAILSGIIMPILIFYMLGKSIRTNEILFDLSSHLMHYYPCVSVGYIVQRYNIFCSINRFFGEMNPRLLLLTGCILCGLFRYSITALDFIYGPVIVFCIGNYLNNCRVHPYIFGVTERFGEYSANIWFIHCAVFSQGIGVSVQKWVYFIKNPFFIYLVIMIAAFYIGNFLTIIDTYIFSMTCIRKKCLR